MFLYQNLNAIAAYAKQHTLPASESTLLVELVGSARALNAVEPVACTGLIPVLELLDPVVDPVAFVLLEDGGSNEVHTSLVPSTEQSSHLHSF
ncbi:hypothetical protein ACEPAF_8109 [Sanghuangporus sanghuang]